MGISDLSYSQYFNLYEPKFIQTVEWSIICFLGWIIFPHLEFRYKLLSKLTNGNRSLANDFLTYFLMYTGTIRNHFFFEALTNSQTLDYGVWDIPVKLIS